MAEVELTAKPEGFEPPVACTLGAEDVPARLAEWREVLGSVTRREPIAEGLRLVLAADAPLARLAALAVAEQQCCEFFRFALTVDDRGLGLEVTARGEGQAVVAELFGGAAAT
ncbi:MAG TPA: hypothetical protein VMY88_13030 [Acidimicrobiales bacterium]|nr:hypothetical protein [Acidimicrobiales bacterium]